MTTSYASTTNACKLCRPLGAAIAFRGIEGCVPFVHGSQGCATYMRRYIISHFNEPIDIASSSLSEKHAIYGGAANLKIGLRNVGAKYAPSLIGVATSCLTETIGEDVPRILADFHREFGAEPQTAHVATPSYAGTHMEGFHGAVAAVVEQMCDIAPANDTINLLPGFLSPADLRYLKKVCADFALDCTLLPDYSQTLDGPALRDYPLIPEGGTPLTRIRTMGGARATIELGSTLPSESAGRVLARRHRTPLRQLPLPIGLRCSDAFFALLEELADCPMPSWHADCRGRLIDAMVDGHKYLSGKRVAIYGEEDLVAGLASFAAEIGLQPVLCASGGKSGSLRQAVQQTIGGLGCCEPLVAEDVDFHQIGEMADSLDVDLFIGHSKGYSHCRGKGIPLIRVGFPIHDRLGGQRLLHIGYDGALQLYDTVVNTVIAQKQDSSAVGYAYM